MQRQDNCCRSWADSLAPVRDDVLKESGDKGAMESDMSLWPPHTHMATHTYRHTHTSQSTVCPDSDK